MRSDELGASSPTEVGLIVASSLWMEFLGTERVLVVIRKHTSPLLELANLTLISETVHGSREDAWVVYVDFDGESHVAWNIKRNSLLHELLVKMLSTRIYDTLLSVARYQTHLLEAVQTEVKHVSRYLLGSEPNRVLCRDRLSPNNLAREILQTVTEEKLLSFVPSSITPAFVHSFLRDKGIVEWLPEWP